VIEKHKALVIDIDGTLCPVKGSDQKYADLPVEPRILARLNALKADGWRIILSSSRGMRTYDGNQGEILLNVLPELMTWLKSRNVPFDEIWMAKPWPGHDGFYVDDRTVRPREFVEHSLEELAEICERDRLA
jgi:capsule biosynthesis phosphatase